MRTVAVALLLIALTACGNAEADPAPGAASASPEATEAAATTLVMGRVYTPAGHVTQEMADNDDCRHITDIAAGEPVQIYAANGDRLGYAELEAPVLAGTEEWECQYAFTLEDVPADAGPYMAEYKDIEQPFDVSSSARVEIKIP